MKTKDLILETARKMISQVGFHKSTTSGLAKAANISEGTIYRHFESKEDILLHILDGLEEQFAYYIGGLRQMLDKDDCSFDIVMSEFFVFVEENEVDMQIMLSTYSFIDSSKRLMDIFVKNMEIIFQECITLGIKKGIIKKVGVEENSTIIISILFGLTRKLLYWPIDKSIRKEAIEFCRRSLLN